MAATVYGEARGEGQIGQRAVAAVIMNRAKFAATHKRKQFGDGSVHSACLAPYQFSCWNKADPNRDKLQALNFEKPGLMLDHCIDVAVKALAGGIEDPTHGALYYKRTDLDWPKDWGPEVAPIAVIGRHSFYRLDEP